MNKNPFGDITERLDKDRYETDTEESHIKVNQEAAAKSNAADLLIRICPAHVYSKQPDGSINVMYAACLECGTCLAAAPAGVLSWQYPRSGMGIIFRES